MTIVNGDGVDSESDGTEQPAATAVGQGVDPEITRLLRAARKVLDRSGWWGFKIESVLREANLSTRSFYRHFASKNELLMAVLEAEIAQAVRRLSRAATIEGSPQEQLASWVEATLAMAYDTDLARPASLLSGHWREMLSEFPERMTTQVDAFVGTLSPVLERGRQAGTWPNVRPREDGICVFYIVAALTADLAAAKAVQPHDETWNIVMPFIEKALGAPAG